MHACFVSLSARGAFCPGQGRVGGAEVQVRRFSDYLVHERAWTVTVLVGDDGQPAEERVNGVRLLKVAQPPRATSALGRLRRNIASAAELMRMTRAVAADIYIQRSAGIETGLVQRAAAAVRKPFVYMCANDWEFDPPWSRGGGATGMLFRRGLRCAALRLAQTESQAARMRSVYGLPAEVLPNMFTFSHGTECPDCRALLWAGRCRAQKQPMAFVELARLLPEIPAIMVASPSEYDPALFEIVREAAGALPHCEFIPGLPADRMHAIYRRASMLVNTSSVEGMPNTFLEAVDAGLALAALVVDPHYMFRDAAAGICAEGDLNALAGGIRALWHNEVERRRLADNAHRWLVERHDCRLIGERFANMLEGVAAHGK